MMRTKQQTKSRFCTHRRCCVLVLLVLVCLEASGCSLGVMAGKLFFGDPLLTCEFTKRTNVDLSEEQKKVLVICSTPESIRSDYPSLNYDLLEQITYDLKRQGIEVQDTGEVATWLDDNGGVWNDVDELAENFKVDYIIHVDIDEFDYREPNSPNLLRGKTFGTVAAYEVHEVDGIRRALSVFESDYTSEYPSHMPVSIEQESAKVFRKKYLDRIADQIGRFFYNYHSSEDIY
ncbi:hypothetical protein [Gimesia panareensis]|uniref:Uncharacterized protein n=1 Tax=Gimesia panareensis TaxID=2527978 RepID=A0A517QFC7_9PLAN|nr:hypothetical protein [Gimesia panareensis]QDT30285.1 hypothetical protein Enr10x_56500 [Gimesia panareensis]QDU53360.1 hypothetical protein Pan110_57500 [Gimesia panareensis]